MAITLQTTKEIGKFSDPRTGLTFARYFVTLDFGATSDNKVLNSQLFGVTPSTSGSSIPATGQIAGVQLASSPKGATGDTTLTFAATKGVWCAASAPSTTTTDVAFCFLNQEDGNPINLAAAAAGVGFYVDVISPVVV